MGLNGRVDKKFGAGRRRVLAGIFSLGLAWMVAGCAGPGLPPVTEGFHAPRPFQAPAAGAAPGRRQMEFESYRAILIDGGFQVGRVPMNAETFARHLDASGFPDLEKDFAGSMATAQGLGVASTTANLISPFLPSRFLRRVGSWIGFFTGAASVVEADSAVRRAAWGYNQRLLQALALPPDEADMAPVGGLPAPLDSGPVLTGPNESLGDWVWSRCFHASVPGGRTLVGGLPIGSGRVPEYLASQDSPDLAARYVSGSRESTLGGVVPVVGLVAFLAGASAALNDSGQQQSWGAPVMLGGLLAVPVGVVVGFQGAGRSGGALLEFNARVPGLLQARLGTAPAGGGGTP